MKKTLILCMTALCGLSWPAQAQNSCTQQEFAINMATPVSSRINWKGDPIEAVLTHDLPLSSSMILPAGSLLKGKVAAVKSSEDVKKGEIRLTFTIPANQSGSAFFPAQVATPDGWLRQRDENTPVWQLDPNRSTRLLNQKIEQRVTSNRAVWASVLGINQNTIPQIGSDEFMVQYNRNDVMVGVSDTLKLRLNCP